MTLREPGVLRTGIASTSRIVYWSESNPTRISPFLVLYWTTFEVNMNSQGANTNKAVAERQAASAQLQQDIRLSLVQNQNLPDMLMQAPAAINLLGHIKLLAFSDHALRIRLTEPNGGFQHLRQVI